MEGLEGASVGEEHVGNALPVKESSGTSLTGFLDFLSSVWGSSSSRRASHTVWETKSPSCACTGMGFVLAVRFPRWATWKPSSSTMKNPLMTPGDAGPSSMALSAFFRCGHFELTCPF